LVGEWDDVISLDLIHCRVCGEVLYSPAFQQKIDSKLKSTSEALCPKHRQSDAAAKLRHSKPGKHKTRLP
ncbi:MAG: hypothetical protein PVH70_16245, partial [Desulfobacterales bacterium]|jgi:hypothetical protein